MTDWYCWYCFCSIKRLCWLIKTLERTTLRNRNTLTPLNCIRAACSRFKQCNSKPIYWRIWISITQINRGSARLEGWRPSRITFKSPWKAALSLPYRPWIWGVQPEGQLVGQVAAAQVIQLWRAYLTNTGWDGRAPIVKLFSDQCWRGTTHAIGLRKFPCV